MKCLISLSLLALTAIVNGGFLTGHHSFPAIISTRTIIGGAVGNGPAYSGGSLSSQTPQTFSSSSQIHSAISTYNPVTYGQGYGGQGQGEGQGQGQNGQSTNNPSVIAYGTYGLNQGQSGQNQGQGGQIQGQNGQRQGQSQGRAGLGGAGHFVHYNYGHY